MSSILCHVLYCIQSATQVVNDTAISEYWIKKDVE